MSPAHLVAPADWHTVDVLSDMHLCSHDPQTFAVWADYMGKTPAQAVLLLGDWFELWVGDDTLTGPPEHSAFAQAVAKVMQSAAKRLSTFVMHGNRDFLIGEAMLSKCGASFLSDPTILAFGDSPQSQVLLSHGDALCTTDLGYMAFRSQVRNPVWQADFLAKPLADRLKIGQALREQSAHAQAVRDAWVDVDAAQSLAWMSAANAGVFVHGHTHEGKTHALGAGQRWVTLDWHASASARGGERAQVLRITRACAKDAQQGHASDELNIERINVLS